MAKVNLWLRGARGKFAGTSLSKGANGETIAREVVTPFNPNTDKQLYQRMIMATVMAAYGAGKEIFDHSFQGKSKGSACQQYFMQRNLERLRSAVAEDVRKVNEGTLPSKKCTTVVVGPRTHTPAPGNFLVSEGTYPQRFFTLKMKTNNMGFVLSVPTADGPTDTVAQYAARNGLVPGDIYTLVAFSVRLEDAPVWIGVDSTGRTSSDAWDYQMPCDFQFWRIQVKDDVLTNTAVVAALDNGAFMQQFFNLTEMKNFSDESYYRLNNPLEMSIAYNDTDYPSADTLEYDFNVGSFAIIRSRFDQDLRSTTSMKTNINIISQDADNGELFCGISAGSALTQWKQHVQQIGSSNLTLESNS